MSLDQYLAMFAFAFAMSATPGPNTMMLFASGLYFGFRATVPHMLGIPFGLVTMLLAIGLGLGALIDASPVVGIALKIASVVYMLWLAYGIATTERINDSPSRGNAQTVMGAALFQWVNPKAWAMALTSVSAYTVPANYAFSLAVLTVTLTLISLPITAAWTGLGMSLRQFLERPGYLRTFNVTMALILIASLWPIVRDLWGLLHG